MSFYTPPPRTREKKARVPRVLVCRARIDPACVSAVIEIPGLKLPSEANLREQWFQKSARVKRQKNLVATCLLAHREPFPPLPAYVRIIRIGKNELDTDNLSGSAKHARDAIADFYGVDDRDPLITWDVKQEKAKEYAVRVEISAMPADDVDRLF